MSIFLLIPKRAMKALLSARQPFPKSIEQAAEQNCFRHRFFFSIWRFALIGFSFFIVETEMGIACFKFFPLPWMYVFKALCRGAKFLMTEERKGKILTSEEFKEICLRLGEKNEGAVCLMLMNQERLVLDAAY